MIFMIIMMMMMMMMIIIIIISLKEVYVPSLWLLTVFKDDFFGFRV